MATVTWAAQYISEILEREHAAKTMALVRAVQQRPDTDSGAQLAAEEAVGIGRLQTLLAGQANASTRNRLLREWLAANRLAVQRLWETLGFPPPDPAAALAGPAAQGACGATGAALVGLAIFDFDETLAVKQVTEAPARELSSSHRSCAMF